MTDDKAPVYNGNPPPSSVLLKIRFPTALERGGALTSFQG